MADANGYRNGDGNGISLEWRRVWRRVRVLQMVIMIGANLVVVAAVGGFYANVIFTNHERNAERIEKNKDTLALHRAQLAALQTQLGDAETATARLEEQLKAQGRQLDRIESLLERMAVPRE